MAYSRVEYTGNGTQTNFTFSFPYISQTHVKVSLDTVDTGFTWVNSNTIKISPAPAAGVVVAIYRETSRSSRLVDFENGAIVNENSLDTSALQSFYLAQEAIDAFEASIAGASAVTWDAKDRRIVNLADPEDDQDAVTKLWAETSMDSQVATAITKATEAGASAAAASSSESNAAASEAAAELAASQAQAVVDESAIVATGTTAARSLADHLGRGALASSITVNIPTDYSTLQDAIDALSGMRVSNGITITLLIESGHQPTGGISVSDGDYGRFIVSAEDAEVTLDSSFPAGTDFIESINARAPVLNCLVDANGLARYGVNCQRGAHITVNSGCGVKNADQRGIYLNQNSTADASHTIWTGVGTVVSTGIARGAWVSRGSTLIAENADFSDSEGVGVYVSRASTVHAMDIKVMNAGNEAVWVHRTSRFTAHSVTNGGVILSNKASSVFSVLKADRSSSVSVNADAGSAPVTITQNGSGAGVICANASIVNIHSADLVGKSSSGSGISCSSSGCVTASSVTIDGFDINIECNSGKVSAALASITDARSIGVWCRRGEVTVASSSVTGSATSDLSINDGGIIRADGCSTTNGVGSPALEDTNVTAFNSLDGRGVLFV